jgi:hypothetical protein
MDLLKSHTAYKKALFVECKALVSDRATSILDKKLRVR